MVRVTVAVDAAGDSDAEELGQLTGGLRVRLLELDVEAVELACGDQIPLGAKSADAVAVGALVVTLAPAVLKALVDVVEAWLTHRPVRSATVIIDGDSLELNSASRADQHQLVQAFIDRHARQ